MTKKSDILHYIAKVINEEQANFSQLKADMIRSGLIKTKSGQESLEILTTIHEAKREMLDKLYKEIQSM